MEKSSYLIERFVKNNLVPEGTWVVFNPGKQWQFDTLKQAESAAERFPDFELRIIETKVIRRVVKECTSTGASSGAE